MAPSHRLHDLAAGTSNAEENAVAGSADSSDQTWSVEAFEQLAEDDRYRFELVRGRLVREPAPVEEHGRLQIRLGRLLDEFVEAHELGLVVGAVGYVLSETPAATIRVPDLSFIAGHRLQGGYPARRFRRMAPDLAVEIVSPSNRASAIREKSREYLIAGARLVWIVDPARLTVSVWLPRTEVQVLGTDEVLDGGDVLPGFRLAVGRLFAP
jgi:Uma2 family endonuclease